MTKKEKAEVEKIARSVEYWRDSFRSLPEGAQAAIKKALEDLRSYL